MRDGYGAFGGIFSFWLAFLFKQERLKSEFEPMLKLIGNSRLYPNFQSDIDYSVPKIHDTLIVSV
ncbi:MAG: hypothetical protein CML13_09475 [Puniceicoccaceae bacterium]|nr:hypothetical protein [Puniceicoccaceae bacterium]